ncbi:MAG TPA: NADH-quinone oxidoreductase subunit NuoF [bacterium]|nr:NADH-quinone oxidoreductase subunit NuoF [bacterium]HPN43271.1 NADH-quinone oxidoreductase subunit NuoF [bacterium]
MRIGLGSCCIAGGSGQVQEALLQTLSEQNIHINVKRVGCVGMCHQTPLVEIALPGKKPVVYNKVQPGDILAIIHNHFRPRGIYSITGSLNRFMDSLIADRTDTEIKKYPLDMRDQPVAGFLGPQVHIATENYGIIDPLDLDEYRRHGGFTALEKCLLHSTPDEVIATIKNSGLRGRGGAGFPTGMKWDLVKVQHNPDKYIICNGDEGDPGAFMDRMLLESYPYRIIEGMIIGAYAVGAHTGYLYIRAEYPLAVRRINQALDNCRQAGILGNNLLNSSFSLTLQVKEGAGAFVCGEESALIASMEGKRGMPRIRPPFPSEQGLWGKPTLVNNTETFALVSWIFRHGAENFAKLGTLRSKGTKVFALAGKINRGGLIEVPMGITIREIVENIGGGIAGGKTFKAVQIGGPSGGCVPAELADIGIDYEALTGVGAMMGSGGLLVMDENDCMVDIARYFLSFTQDQSCGKCTFCRIGTRRMLDILERLCAGQGTEQDIINLEYLAEKTRQGSLCGLGKSAPNPILTTLKYFRHEYEEHLDGYCRAKKCKALITYQVNDNCNGCTRCAQNCPVNAITLIPYQKHSIDTSVCIRCDTCRQVCPVNAVEVHSCAR